MPPASRRRAGAPYYVIVRGPLGAGKTTVARALARSIRGGVVGIDALLEAYPWDGGSEALFLRTNREAARAVRALFAAGRPAVVDGNFYWARALDDLARRLGPARAVVTLDVPRAVCTARDRGRRRSYGPAAVREVYRKAARVRRGTRVDGRRSVAEIVRTIRTLLAGPPAPSTAGRAGRVTADRRPRRPVPR